MHGRILTGPTLTKIGQVTVTGKQWHGLRFHTWMDNNHVALLHRPAHGNARVDDQLVKYAHHVLGNGESRTSLIRGGKSSKTPTSANCVHYKGENPNPVQMPNSSDGGNQIKANPIHSMIPCVRNVSDT